MFWLWNCIDFTFWITVRLITDWLCNFTASCLFFFIERIIEPNISAEKTIEVMFWFITLPFIIMNMLLKVLPSFHNYRNTVPKTTPGCCASGRHGKRGRHSDRHHVWWNGSAYRKKYKHKEHSPRKKHRIQRCLKEREIRQKIDLLQYFDPLVMPSNMFVIDDDVYYDTRTVYYGFFYDERNHHRHPPPLSIPINPIDELINSFDVLSHYKQIIAFEEVLFFNSHYRRLDPSSPEFSGILIQARHLKSQVFHYDTTLNNNTDSTLEIYVSSVDGELPIVIDTGASNSITPIASDFVGGVINKADLQSLTQVNGTTPVCGQGPVNWPIEDVDGVRRTITTDAYFVPDARIRLFSPQVYIGNNKTSNMLIDHNGIRFTLKCGTVLRFPFNKGNNLPFMLTETSLRARKRSHLTSSVQVLSSKGMYTSLIDRSVFNRDNFNLNPAQQELLKWHCRWCHCDFNRVRMILARPRQPKGAEETGELVRQMVVPSESGTSSCQSFCCTACLYAKQKRKTPDSSTEIKNKDFEGALTSDDLNPGDKVSCDQYMSPSKGRLLHTKGQESSSKQYVGGTIFIDHATNFLFTNHQVNLTAASTVESKHKCESMFDEFGVQIKQYAADNHPFRSKAWVSDCALQRQLPTKHSGVGAHHQILAERQIQTTFNWSRANLLHFVLHWPQMAKNRDNLWPFAINYAVYMHNHLPLRDKRFSPTEIFTGTVFNNYNHLTRAHVFGCPVYVLDPRLQDSKKIPKWSMRSRRGIYLGISKLHSSTVHLILNPATGAISPQYHCVFDDTFSTVWSDGQFDPSIWECLIRQTEGIEKHHSIEPDNNGNVTLPPDYVPFSQDLASQQEEQQQRHFAPTQRHNNNNKHDVNTGNTPQNNNSDNPPSPDNDSLTTPAPPLLSRRMFTPASPPSHEDVNPPDVAEN